MGWRKGGAAWGRERRAGSATRQRRVGRRVRAWRRSSHTPARTAHPQPGPRLRPSSKTTTSSTQNTAAARASAPARALPRSAVPALSTAEPGTTMARVGVLEKGWR